MRQSIALRLVARVERYLPAVSPVSDVVASGRRHWAAFAAVMPSILLVVTQVASRRVGLGAAWRPMMLDLLLIVAGGVLVAAVAAGAVAWRREAHRHA